jgi:hypothetical protein
MKIILIGLLSFGTLTAYAELLPPKNCSACVLANGFKTKEVEKIKSILESKKFDVTMIVNAHLSVLQQCLSQRGASNDIYLSMRKGVSPLSQVSWYDTPFAKNHYVSAQRTKRDFKFIESILNVFPDCEGYTNGEIKFDQIFVRE